MSSPARPLDDAGLADLDLVRRVLRGDPSGVETLVIRLTCIVRFTFRLNRTLGYRLPEESLDDVVQQVYLAVWPRLSTYTGDASIESWVFGYCRNCLRAEARRRASRLRLVRGSTDDDERDVLDAVSGDSEQPPQRCERSEKLQVLYEELDRLPPDERRVVELRHLEDWSFERIAEHLELPASTVKDRCYRALTRMEGRMRRRDVDT